MFEGNFMRLTVTEYVKKKQYFKNVNFLTLFSQ